MITSVTRQIGFDMGHRVPNHSSKCRNVHGHRYTAFITLKGDTVGLTGDSSEGMVVDFSDIKTVAQGFIDLYLDHGYMGHETLDKTMLDTLVGMGSKCISVKFIPTAENIAAWLFSMLEQRFSEVYGGKEGYDFHLDNVELFETPNCSVVADRASVAGWDSKLNEATSYMKDSEEHMLILKF